MSIPFNLSNNTSVETYIGRLFKSTIHFLVASSILYIKDDLDKKNKKRRGFLFIILKMAICNI